MQTICFVILHFKDNQVTDTCVQSILNMDQQDRIKIVIVDNDIQKSDKERAALSAKYEKISNIEILKIKEIGGFSYANNQGYQYARQKLKASYIVVINNDIEFTQRDFVARLENSYEEHPCQVLGPDIIRRGTGEHQNPMDTRVRTAEEARYTIRMNHFAMRFYPVMYPVVYYMLKRAEKKKMADMEKQVALSSCVRENIVPFGACLIFTPMFVEKEEKAFTPETQFFYEEYILTLRCQKKGYRIVYDPAMVVKHESGSATKKSFGTEKKRIRFMMEKTAKSCEIYLKLL